MNCFVELERDKCFKFRHICLYNNTFVLKILNFGHNNLKKIQLKNGRKSTSTSTDFRKAERPQNYGTKIFTLKMTKNFRNIIKPSVEIGRQ